MRNRTSVSLLTAALASCLALAGANFALAATVVFQDPTFLDANWATTIEVLNLGGTVTATQVASGGNPGAFRQVTNTLNSAIGQGFSNTVFGFHRYSGGVYTPSTSGAILTIDLSAATERVSGGQQAFALSLRQNGVNYYGPIFLNPVTVGTWATTAQPGLTAANFDALAPGLQTPDFSVTASAIELGFMSGNSTSVGGGGGSTVGGIDNWTVTVRTDDATPAASTSWGRVKSLYLGGGAARSGR